MAITLEFPTRYAPISNAPCNWYAAHNPIIVKATRKDYDISGCVISPEVAGVTVGKVRVNLPAAIAADDIMTAGDWIYIRAGAAGDIEGVFQLLEYTPGDSFLYIDLDWTTNAVGGWINLNSSRSDYRLKIHVKKYNHATSALEYVGIGAYSGNSYGIIEANIQRYTSKAVSLEDDSTTWMVNYADLNQSANLQLEFEESYSANTAPAILYATAINVVNAAMQNGNLGGSNMVRFSPEPTGTDKVEFLTDFKRPTVWIAYGIKWDVGFIHNLNLVGLTLGPYRIAEIYSGSTLTTTDIDAMSISSNQRGTMNRINLNGVHFTGADRLDLWIGNSSGSIRLTEKLSIDIETCTPKNPVLVRWASTNGGWNYWVFGVTQTTAINQKQGSVFEKFVSDIQYKNNSGKYIGHQATPSMVLTAAGLTSQKADGMETLLSSVEVQIYFESGPWSGNWITARKTGSKYTRETKHKRHQMEITVDLMDINTQTQ